ncbi:GNAT family N-acetyltransferase [Patescibacteria group bacterium]
MSYYQELVSNPGVVVARQVEGLYQVETGLQQNVGAVLLRMGEFKALYASTPWQLLVPDRVFRLEAEKDEAHDWFAKPELVAAAKAMESDVDIRKQAELLGAEVSADKLALSVGQDVMVCDAIGNPINKPEKAAFKEEIFASMFSMLGNEEGNSFRLKSGLAVYGKDGEGSGKGVMLASQHKFTVSPFSEAELELYVYGVAGRDGVSPSYLQDELDKFVSEGWIYEEEKDFYAQGLSVEELRQTNGGFRWPHPVFIRHINEIDGVKIEEEGFDLKRQELFLSLLGASPEIMYYGNNLVTRLKEENGESWQRAVVLKDGSLAEVEDLSIQNNGDIAEISQMIHTNFLEHDHYNDLDAAARQEFLRVNTVEELLDACRNENNLMVRVLRQNGIIIGFCLLRQVDEKKTEIRRLHTRLGHNGLGIGRILVEEAIAEAKHIGLTTIAAPTSGHSDEFFHQMGFNGNGRGNNAKLQQRGVEAPVHYCERHI